MNIDLKKLRGFNALGTLGVRKLKISSFGEYPITLLDWINKLNLESINTAAINVGDLMSNMKRSKHLKKFRYCYDTFDHKNTE